MNAQQNQVTEDVEKLKEIPKWTRKYAQNRTLTILVLMVMAMLFSMSFALLFVFPFILALRGFSKGNIILGCVGIAVLVALLVAYFICLLIFIRKFGGKNRGLIDHKIDHWIYGREGMTSMPMPEATKKKKWLEITAGTTWLSLFIGTMCLGMENYIPAKYVQPISALYCVPYMVIGWYFWRSPRMGPIYLLSPILYAVHAILIVAGVPIFFTGQLGAAFNMCLPLIGYGLVPFIVGHIYSRYALKKLRTTAHLEENTSEQ
jgi:drug/metabolite transporter (DMT)-like permease